MSDQNSSLHTRPLTATWRQGLTIVNLRGNAGKSGNADNVDNASNASNAGFAAGATQALGVALPLAPCSTHAATEAVAGDGLVNPNGAVERIVWAGPDEWFVIAAAGRTDAIERALRTSLADLHHAITDVGSGYSVLRLSGPPVREVLAQGCPLDLHPRAYGVGRSAGSHFFKASVLLWQTDSAPQFELLVRRSFVGYVQLMLQRCTLECGLSMN